MDPEQGLGLSAGWEPPAHWFEGVEPAPEMAFGGAPPAPLDAPLEGDWVPSDWYQPQALEGVREQLYAPQAPAPLDGEEPLPYQAAPQQQPAPMPWEPGQPSPEEQRYAAMPEEDLAAEQSRQRSAQEQHVARRTMEEFDRNRSEVSANHTALRDGAMEARRELLAIDGDLRELSGKSIDTNRWWNSRSTGQKVAAYASAFIGGLFKVHNQGRNSTLEMIDGAIDADVEAQKADIMNRRGILEQRRGLVGELYAKTGDMYRAAETARIAMLDGVEKQIMAEAAQLDPRGTQAANAVAAANAVRAAKEERRMTMEQVLHERAMDKARLNLQRAQLAQGRQQHAREEARYQSEHGVVYDDKAGRYQPDPTAPPPKEKPSDTLARMEIESKTRGVQVTDSRGQVIGEARGGPAAGEEIRKDVAGYEEFRTALGDLNDRIAATVQKYGGLGSDRWKPEDVAAIEALHKPLVFKLARAMNGPGPLSQADVDAAKGSVPTLDTWTTSRKPGAVYDAMVAKADTELNKRLGVQVIGFDASKSPTARYQSMDRLKEKPGEADTREGLLKRAGDPITPLSKADPDIRRAAIAGRIAVLDDLRDRKEGLSEDDVADLRAKFARELAQGDLSTEEHAGLVEYLEVQGGMGQRRRRGREFQESVANQDLSAPRVGQRR